MKCAYFAGGCFWCITPIFRETDGVISVTSGYSGGDEKDPAYPDVKAQLTGHRETIKIEYDEARVTFSKLLDVFTRNVDVFDGGGQYIDRGASYTLAVYCCGDDEIKAAREKVRRIEDESKRPVYISVEPFKSFYPAEDEHQDFDLKNPSRFLKELVESGRKKPEG